MADINNIGYLWFGDTARLRIDFGSDGPLNDNQGSNGVVFNLSDDIQRAHGSSNTVDEFSLYLPDGSVLPLDNFTDEALGLLQGIYDSGIMFEGTDQNDVHVLEGLDNVVRDGLIEWIEYDVTEGKDKVIFPEGGQEWNESAGSGTIDARNVFADQFWNAYGQLSDPSANGETVPFDFSFAGLTYSYSNAHDLTIKSASGSSVYVDLQAENAYKVFDSQYTNDTFRGSAGTQVFRSQGGYDVAYGGAGEDIFRIDGSFLTAESADPAVYDLIGHNLYIRDYALGERIQIEDFNLTSASEIRSEIVGTNTYIYANVDGEDRNLVTLSGKFEYGVVYSRGDEKAVEGTDYGIVFYNPATTLGGTTAAFKGNDDFALFGRLWSPDLDTKFLGIPSQTIKYVGGDGNDDFSGGAGNDHFDGGQGNDRVLYFDSSGIQVAESFYDSNELQTVIYDGLGYGGIDTLSSIRDIYASTGDDRIELYSNPDGIERVILSAGNDTVIGDVTVGYWNLFESGNDPRGINQWDFENGVQAGVTDASVNVNLADGTVTKQIVGGDFAGTYTDTLIGVSAVVGSEGNDILNVTTDSMFEGFTNGLIGNDLIEDLGSGYDWLTGGHGDDVIISGNYVDTVFGDYKSDYYQTSGVDTFAVYGSGFTTIADFELGEQVWWLSTDDTLGKAPDPSDIIVTLDFANQATKIGVLDESGSVNQRLEISGFYSLDLASVAQFNAEGASALINDQVADLQLTFVTEEAIPYQVTDLGASSDKFYGGEEWDIVTTGGGADYLSLGAGDDIAVVDGLILTTDKNPYITNAKYAFVDTGLGDDTIEISSSFDGEVRLVSGGGIDKLVIDGDAGSFSWSAGTGVDQNNLILTSNGTSIVLTNQMAFEENPVFSYVEFVSVDPQTGEETSEIFQVDPNAPPVNGGLVTVLGTNSTTGDDIEIPWDSGPVSVAGLKGDDIIEGGMSDDVIDGGEGDDLLFGGSGEDTLSGGVGEDMLDGGHGSDKLFGGAGDDVYKIDLSYSGFLDVAGYDNVVLNDDGTINHEASPENPWDLTIGNVDTISDDSGTDRIWITNFQPTLNPFDQYKDMLSIDGDGTLVMKWGWDAESPTSYQYTLKEGFDHQIFDALVLDAKENGGYIATKSNVNSPTEQPKYTYPVFDKQWQAENFYREQNGLNFDAPSQVHKIKIAPRNIINEGELGYALESATSVKWLEVWVPGPEGTVNESSTLDFAAYPGMVNIADTFYYNKIDKDYEQGGTLDALAESGQHTQFDLGRIETWPGFEDLPVAIDPNNPEAGSQEYYLKNFELGNSSTYPTAGEMRFVDVIINNIVSMDDLDKQVSGEHAPSHDPNNPFATVSNEEAELAQGFKVTDFAVKDEHGNWVNTIESIVFTSPTGEQAFIDEYGQSVDSGLKSVYDSLTQALTSNMGTEYFLSPSGVVDFGTERTPLTFNTDGSVKTYREVTKWKGADTDKSFFLIANTDMAGRNELGLGFDETTDDITDSSDRNAATPVYVR
ncbi:hypothetical protein N8Z70_01820, partial [Candidatus Puniceispirillum sp.]|nr:hypothetical protein [Candidatus Puniceispirillum sp.]